MELGQDLMRATIGEGFTATPLESDLDGAEEAYARAAALAEELGDKRTLAHATRELGVVAVSRVRAWFVERIKANEHLEIIKAVASGAPLLDIVRTVAIYPVAVVAEQRLQRALELFTELADRRGAMSTLIAMAYLSWGPDIHIGSNPVQRIEEVRRLMTSMSAPGGGERSRRPRGTDAVRRPRVRARQARARPGTDPRRAGVPDCPDNG